MAIHPLKNLLSQLDFKTLYAHLKQTGKLNDPKTLRELLYLRGYRDMEFFARWFFVHHCRAPFSRMHLDFCRDELDPEQPGRREAIAAPRGHAKTTFKLLIKAIHAIVYEYERYILVVGQSATEAEDKVRGILDELESNDRLIEVFGRQAPDNVKPGRKKAFITRNGIKVQAKSVGQQIRGIKHGPHRPTLIILDDVETLESALSPQQRYKTRDWFFKDVLKCGETDGSSKVIFIGTCLHHESLLSELLVTPGWMSRKYQAILNFSRAEALWDRWTTLYTDLTNPNREADALAFYGKHEAEMLAGTEVLWPEVEPYLALMKQIVAEGQAAFHSEKQNEPFDPTLQIFRMDEARYCHFSNDSSELIWDEDPNRKVPLRQLKQIIAFHDPALGAKPDQASDPDYAAIVVVGQDLYGYIYVLDCYLAKDPPSLQVEKAFALHAKWQLDALYFESNGFQSLIKQMYDDYQALHPVSPALRVLPVEQATNKVQRIATLEPDIANGYLIFTRSLDPRLLQQMTLFPTTHDDGPDALQGAVYHLKATVNSVRTHPARYSASRSRQLNRDSRRPWL